jgi:hypothetical protein
MDTERTAWRKQALAWLQADLEAWRQRREGGSAVMHGTIKKSLRHWQTDDAFAALRDAGAEAKLPDDEREEWRRLWEQVSELLATIG